MDIKKLLLDVLDGLSKKYEKPETNKPMLYTEEDILKAMENLPDVTLEKEIEYGYKKEELTHSVPKVGVWSKFEYLSVSPHGKKEGKKTPFFVIPCGWEYESELKMWYIGVHYNDMVEEVFEFYTGYDFTAAKDTTDKY